MVIKYKIPEVLVEILSKWFDEHSSHPYAKTTELNKLAVKTGLTCAQVDGWLQRKRHLLNKIKQNESTTKTVISRRLPENAIKIMIQWYEEHETHPYPSKKQTEMIAQNANLTCEQVKRWFQLSRCKTSSKIRENRLYPQATVDILSKWYKEHESYSYPTKDEAEMLAQSTNLTVQKVKKWLGSKRSFEIKFLSKQLYQRPPSKLYSKSAVDILKNWFKEHENHPYPTKEEVEMLADKANLTYKNVRSWFDRQRHLLKSTIHQKTKLDKHNHSPAVIDILTKWFDEHKSNPYAAKEDCELLSKETNLTAIQIRTWINHKRLSLQNIKHQKLSSLNKFPQASVDVLTKWFECGEHHSCPTHEEAEELANKSNLSVRQVKNWIYRRRNRRYLTKYEKPSVVHENQALNRFSQTATDVLKKWFDEHHAYPYPSKKEAEQLAVKTNLTYNQITQWFDNEHKRASGVNKPSSIIQRLPQSAVDILTKWFDENQEDPYASKQDYEWLSNKTNLTTNQISSWLSQKRRRSISSKKEQNQQMVTRRMSKKLNEQPQPHHPDAETDDEVITSSFMNQLEKTIKELADNEVNENALAPICTNTDRILTKMLIPSDSQNSLNQKDLANLSLSSNDFFLLL